MLVDEKRAFGSFVKDLSKPETFHMVELKKTLSQRIPKKTPGMGFSKGLLNEYYQSDNFIFKVISLRIVSEFWYYYKKADLLL